MLVFVYFLADSSVLVYKKNYSRRRGSCGCVYRLVSINSNASLLLRRTDATTSYLTLEWTFVRWFVKLGCKSNTFLQNTKLFVIFFVISAERWAKKYDSRKPKDNIESMNTKYMSHLSHLSHFICVYNALLLNFHKRDHWPRDAHFVTIASRGKYSTFPNLQNYIKKITFLVSYIHNNKKLSDLSKLKNLRVFFAEREEFCTSLESRMPPRALSKLMTASKLIPEYNKQ